MPKVICTLPNASEEINGVPFTKHARGMISADIPAEVAARFLRITGYEPDGKAPPAPPLSVGQGGDNNSQHRLTLIGSSELPAVFEIGGKQVQLGDIVNAAHAASGLTIEQWNEQPDAEREQRLIDQVEALTAEADKKAEEAAAKEELKALHASAKELGMKGFTKMDKDTLVAEVEKAKAAKQESAGA